MPRLREIDRGRAIDLLMQGFSQSQVARQLGVAQSTVSRLRQRLRATGRLADRPRSGRPRETTRRQDRAIRLAHLRDRFRTAVETAANTPGRHNNRIHPKTVRNRLKEVGLYARRPYVGPQLTHRRRQIRMNWLRRHSLRQFPMHRWRQVLFSDESRFSLYRADGRKRVYRRRGERFTDACVMENDRFGGGSVMVWGGIAHGLKTPLIVVNGNLNAIQYRDRILRQCVVPFVQRHNLTFQQDNARPHVARVCRDFLNQNNVIPLDWPPYSPDLSPIEHLWDELDRRVRSRRHVPNNVQQLTAALQQEWNHMPLRKINALINSMANRIREATQANGGHTRF